MKTYEIDNGINLHIIQTDKFKSNIICILFREQLNKKTVTQNVLIPLLLEQGSKKYKDNKKINRQVDNMFGSTFDIQTIKKGEEQILQFYFEYANNEEITTLDVLNFLYEIIYNTNIEGDKFNKNLFDIQKRKMKNRIQRQVNNKADYAKQKIFEISCKGEMFSINPLGYEEDLGTITNESIVIRYKEILKKSNIDFIYQGNSSVSEVLENIESIFSFEKKERNFEAYEKNNYSFFKNEEQSKLELNIEQSILCMTLKSKQNKKLNAYHMILLSEILGGNTNSLLFKKIREEDGLCYYIYTTLYIAKRIMLVQCGTRKENVQTAINKIKNIFDNIELLIDVEDINVAKNSLIRQYKLIQDNNSSSINFYLTQYLNELEIDLSELINNINKIDLNDIINISKEIKIDCILSLE